MTDEQTPTESPRFPVPPPPRAWVASTDTVTTPQSSLPDEPPTPPEPAVAGPEPADPPDPSGPFDTPPAPAAGGAGGMSGPAPVGSPVPPSPPRRARRAVAVVVAAGLMAASAAGGALLALNLEDDDDPGTATTSLSAAPTSGSQDSAPDEPLSQVAADVLPSVVSITATPRVGDPGQGSGVIISSDGQVLTNNHVVALAVDGGELSVTLPDGTRAGAEILGRDPATDLAVIQAEDVDGLTPAALGSSADLNVGDTVVAVGSPLGLDGSVTAGIVSALNRSITLEGVPEGSPESPFGDQSAPTSAVIDAIQTDAAINPGNSGGALVNGDGEVIGINTAIASLPNGGGLGTGQGGNIGVGFAIPIDSAREIASTLVEDGEVTHAFLGVRIADAEDGAGALIGAVEDGTPADDAGLQPGDVVTRVGDRDVSGASELTSAIRSHRPGDRVDVTYTRDGDENTAEVTLGELPTD
ncbi:MAG: S1C family serine protease [Acidimicrobiales bacterium]